jgi:hypothetical protein
MRHLGFLSRFSRRISLVMAGCYERLNKKFLIELSEFMLESFYTLSMITIGIVYIILEALILFLIQFTRILLYSLSQGIGLGKSFSNALSSSKAYLIVFKVYGLMKILRYTRR